MTAIDKALQQFYKVDDARREELGEEGEGYIGHKVPSIHNPNPTARKQLTYAQIGI